MELRRGYRLFGGLRQGIRSNQVDIAVGQNLTAKLDIGARQAHHHGYRYIQRLHCLDHTFGHPVTTVDAGENVDQNRIDALVR